MSPSKRPNVIVLITDDQGYGDLACHGNPVALTPQMDALHGQSARLTDFHVAPMCTPTRGQLLTGQDAARNGALNVSSGRSLLRADLPTMADVFRASGYRTGVFGKWHLGDNYPYRPEDRGFDEALWFPSSHISSLPDYWENDYFDDTYCHNGVREVYEGYCTEVFFGEAMDWMQQSIQEQAPFFAFLPTNAPHYPWWVPTEDREAAEAQFSAHESELGVTLDPEQRANLIRFLAMIRNIDTQLGRLRDFLQQQQVADDTLVIFMTDNGSTFGHAYFNAGMRGAKCTLWEGGHRVPCFWHWPGGGLDGGRDVGGLTQVQDVLPTLIDLCGLTPPENARFDGMSLAEVLRGEAEAPEERICFINYSRMPPFADYPTPDARSVVRREGAGVLWKRWRLIEGKTLYDLQADPMQESDIAADHPQIVPQLQTALDQWWTEVEPLANEPQHIIIGNEAENPMMLSACEWRDVFVDQQFQARIGVKRNSYWHLKVDRPGTYRFELRRWPRESGLHLQEGCEATEVTDGVLDAGVALPITRARMMVDRLEQRQDIEPGQESAVFTQELEAGPVLLHTWFDDERQQALCGAYYVYVERM